MLLKIIEKNHITSSNPNDNGQVTPNITSYGCKLVFETLITLIVIRYIYIHVIKLIKYGKVITTSSL